MTERTVKFKLDSRLVARHTARFPNTKSQTPTQSLSHAKSSLQAAQSQPQSQSRSSHVPHVSVTSLSREAAGLVDVSQSLAANTFTPAAIPLPSSTINGTSLNLSSSLASSPPPVDPNQFPYSGPVLSKARVKPSFPVIVPSESEWFNEDEVHSIERRAFPELADSHPSQFRAAYTTARNALIAAYRANPRVYLTVTAARRTIACDVNMLIRVHIFLEQWGLINYHCDAGSQPLMGMTTKERVSIPVQTVMPPVVSYNKVSMASAPANVGAVLNHLYSFPTIASKSDSVSGGDNGSVGDSRSALVGPVKAQYQLSNDRHWSLPLLDPYQCTHCHNQCESLRYQYTVDRAVVLCSDCFLRGHFPSLATAKDFARVTKDDTVPEPVLTTSIKDNAAAPWSRTETLALLDALSIHGEDWDAVADALGGTRTRDECCLHFLSMPIEDPYIEQFDRVNSNTNNDSASGRSNNNGKSVIQSVPFADAGNPILAQVAFLASTVSPAVAAAAAHAAMVHLTQDKQSQLIRQSLGSKTSQSPPLTVDTPLGKGVVKGSGSRDDGIMCVRLPFGELYSPIDQLKPILSQAQLTELAQSPIDSTPTSIATVSATCLTAATLKARELSNEEERKLLRLVAELVQCQMRKCELKLKHFAALSEFMDAQRTNLATQRNSIVSEKQRVLALLNQSQPVSQAQTAVPMQM